MSASLQDRTRGAVDDAQRELSEVFESSCSRWRRRVRLGKVRIETVEVEGCKAVGLLRGKNLRFHGAVWYWGVVEDLLGLAGTA